MTQLSSSQMQDAEIPLASEKRTPALAAAFSMESELIIQLTATICDQRSAIESDDIDRIDGTVFAMHRILLTLQECRIRRIAMYQLMGIGSSSTLSEIGELPDYSRSSDLQESISRLRQSAEILAREVRINRGVLREAIIQKDNYASELLNAASSTATVYDFAGNGPKPLNGINLFSATA